jgi:hypothetical protein
MSGFSSAVYSASTSQFLVLDIHGTSFVPNASVLLGSTRLLTLYLGSQHLVVFVQVSRFSSLSEPASVSNPGPGGGRTASVPAGYTATVPLSIPDVETGSMHTGYVIVTGDPGSALPVTTLTYGSVSGAIVQSQAAVLPTPLTASTSMALNVVPGIGRNLGVAIAKSRRDIRTDNLDTIRRQRRRRRDTGHTLDSSQRANRDG